MPVPRLDPTQTAVLLVDVQERLLRVMHEPEALVARAGLLLDAAATLDLPVLVTEQYPKGLGPTVPALAERLADVPRHEKVKFSACVDPVREALAATGASTVLVAGIEAHVCVLQTCLDLLEAGFVAMVVADAVSSRRPLDREVALQRLVQAGVVPTTVESAVLEMVGEAGGERFKVILPLLKD